MDSASHDLLYPEESLGRFSAPPISYTDARGRDIEIHVCDDDFESLVALCHHVTPNGASPRLPPPTDERIRTWLASIATRGYSVVAWHADKPVGHAMLVKDEPDEYELAVYVRDGYRRVGTGTKLVCAVFGVGQQYGVERVWFLVDRWNRAAMTMFQPYRDTVERKLVGKSEYTFAIRL
jgi:GNAT superfamily N-acetyltransferase